MSAKADFDHILKKLGWVDGFDLPVANAENQALQAQIADLIKRKAKAITTLENITSKHNAIQKHLKHVTHEHEETQKFHTAYTQQLQTEESKYQSVKSQKEVTQRQIENNNKTKADIEARQEVKKNDLARCLVKIEKLKSETSWDGEALRAWEEALKKRDEDNEMLEKFAREDERKIHDLEAKRKSLQSEVVEKRKCIERVVTDIMSREQVVERTGKIFKQEKEQRAALIRQWKDAIRNLRQRDKDIDQATYDTIAMNQLLKQKEENLAEKKQFLINEEANNKELQMETSELSSISTRMKRELDNITPIVPLLNNELEATKRTVICTAKSIQKERGTGRQLEEDLNALEEKKEDLQPQIQELQQQLLEIKNSSSSAADRTKHVEKMYEAEQRKEKSLMQEMQNIQSVTHRAQQALNDQKNTTNTKEIEIKSFEISINLSKKHSKNIHNEIQKQTEIIYDMEFRINELENKLAHLEAQVPDTDYYALTKRIEEMEREMAEHSELRHLLQAQMNKLEDEKRRLTSEFASDEERLKSLQNKVQDQLIIFENGSKQMRAAKTHTQEKQVEENVLRLRVHQLEKIVKKEDKHIYNSQKYRLDLETAMKERQIEIDANKDVLMVRKRNLDEENGRLRKDIMGRKAKVEQLQKKYYLTMMSLGKDDEGQPMTISYYKIKNAQDKYMLQMEGDELDHKINQAEKEIVAMENTLKVVNVTNDTYKSNLAAMDEGHLRMKILKSSEKRQDETALMLHKLKTQLKDKICNKEDIQRFIEEATRAKNEALDQVLQLKYEIEHLHTLAAEKHEKMERITLQLSNLEKKVNREVAQMHLTDLLIQTLQSSNKYALSQLLTFTENHPDIEALVKNYATTFGLVLPRKKPSLSSICGSSSTSSSEILSTKPKVNGNFQHSNAVSVASVVLSFDAPPPSKTNHVHLKGKKRK